MLPSNLQDEFLQAMRERIASLFLPEGVTLDDEDFIEWMVKFPEWNLEHAQSLLDGDADGWNWSDEDRLDIARTLRYDEDLLDLFFNPVSLEVIQHTVQEHTQDRTDDCEECEDFRDEMAQQKTLDDAYSVLIGYMNHVYVMNDDDDDDDYEEDEEEITMIRQLLPEFMRLPRSRQYRVLAFLYEQSEAYDDEDDSTEEEFTLSPLAQLVGLRQSLPADLRTLVDQVVTTNDGSAVLKEPNTGAALADSIADYCKTLSERGVDAAEFPLQVEDRGEETWLILDPAYLRSYKALIQADES